MKKLTAILSFVMAVTSCCHENPFLSDYDTPYGIPPFEKISESDYLPAVDAALEQLKVEIDAIAHSGKAPSFENTIAALDRSGSLLGKVEAVLGNLVESDGNDNLRKIYTEILPKVSEASDAIYMNEDLFARVKIVCDEQESMNLTSEQKALLRKTYDAFVQGGVSLGKEDQKRVSAINSELSTLGQEFANNLLSQNNAFRDKFGISVSQYYETMGTEPDRERRKALFEAYSSRCNHGDEFDNKDIVLRILELKIEKANIMGFETPADFILQDKMAGNPERVFSFLEGIQAAANRKAAQEVADMQKVMDREIAEGALPQGSRIEPWDYLYYASKVQAERYNFSEDQVRPYFKMENVRAGVFATASKLYGLSFEKISGVPVYNPEAEAFKVSDADGSLIGILYTDYYPRASKRGGAWMTNFVEQYRLPDGSDQRPVIVNVGNFTKPTAETPSLLTIDEVETMFHEFGHALHGLLSKCVYKGTSGTNVARDFVELPSQINENWAFQKEVLASYARHYETGEVIPDALVAKIGEVSNFNQGFTTSELCAASLLDMYWHTLKSIWVPADSPLAGEKVCPADENLRAIDPARFEAETCAKMGLVSEIIPRYRTTYFNHIFGSSGYSAGYYSYLWAEVLDKDAFEKFLCDGIFNPETARSFRENILSKGGSEDPMVLYRRFRGAEPDPSALLRARGLE